MPLRAIYLAFLILLGASLAPPALAQGLLGGGAPHMRAHLEAESVLVAPGRTVSLAVVMDPEPGWHGYWENPGDAGQPLTLDWSLPAGAMIGPLRYPVPRTLLVSGLMNHVYEGRYAILADLTVPAGAKAGTMLPVRAQARWLVCSDSLCVPEQDDLVLDLRVAAADAPVPPPTAAFDAYRQNLPRPLGATAYYQRIAGGGMRLSIPYPATARLDDPHFFPLTSGATSYAAAQRFVRQGDRLIVALTDMGQGAGGEKSFSGLLRIGRDQGVTVDAQPGTVPAPEEGATGRSVWLSALLALAGALVGGFVLNAMPCVFPILSIKAMSLLRSGASGGHAHWEAWAYTLGVTLTCMGLGGAVLLLRAGGESVGWAFQLQNPVVILFLLGLSVAIAFNFLGFFQLRPLQLDGSLSTRRGMIGDFWSGVLVAFVATPCTGPFMATALGTALLLPVPAALAVFAGLGLGIALPFLLLAYVPALRRMVPKPGAWMETVQRWLAVPMVLTAAALLWLLGRQAGQGGLLIGAGVAVGVALILVQFGRGQRRGAGGFGRGWLALLACLLLLGGAAALLRFEGAEGQGVARGADAFSEASLASARAEGKPVFLYFTADWCLSCKVNEAAAIDRSEVRAAFRKAGVRTLVGDWTRGDPAITRFLEAHGRSGVPLYLWYPADGGAPKELPQLLTPALLADLAEGKGQ